MPGTILVSVLQFEGLYSSSSTPPQMYIKISMGKKEYLTWGKEDISFPLTNLRDNLMIKFHDAEGNEISHTAIETRLVVEKGLWDDIFPLDGGGHVHLKLQFVLSEEERHRIRTMRESALRKKHGGHPSDRLRSPENASTISSNAESSLCLNQEVSDTQNRLLQGEVVARQAGLVSGTADVPKNARFGTRETEEIFSFLKQTIPNETDRCKEISSTTWSQGVDVNLTEVSHRDLVQKIESRTPSDDVPMRAITSEEASFLSRSSEFVVAAKNKLVAPKLDEDGATNSEKPSPVGRAPSNVRNMISAFESSLTQDMRLNLKPPPAKHQPSKNGTEAPLQTLISDEVKSETIKPGRLKNPFFAGGSQKASTYRAFNETTTIAQDIKQLELSAADVKMKGTTAYVKKINIQKKVEIEEGKNSSEDLSRASTGKAATVSGRMLDEHIGRQQPGKLFMKKQQSDGKSSLKESRKGIYAEYSEEMDNKGASNNGLELKENWKYKDYPSRCPVNWIFPVESRSLCMTAGSKHLMDLMVSCHTEAEINQRAKGSAPEKVEESNVHGGGIKGNVGEKSNKKPRNPKFVNSADDETSRGPIGQVMRVAIMIGFATLVIFTRQRKNS